MPKKFFLCQPLKSSQEDKNLYLFGLSLKSALHSSWEPREWLMWTQLICGLTSLSPERRFRDQPRYPPCDPRGSTYLLQARVSPFECKRLSLGGPWSFLRLCFSIKLSTSSARISSSKAVGVKIQNIFQVCFVDKQGLVLGGALWVMQMVDLVFIMKKGAPEGNGDEKTRTGLCWVQGSNTEPVTRDWCGQMASPPVSV